VKISKKRLSEIIREELVNELGGFGHDKHFDITGTSLPQPEKKEKGFKTQYKGYSSKEAKKVVDDGLRMWAKDIRKVEGRVVKDWMTKAKSGVMDYFDLVRGLETGDISRAHPEETKFFKALLDRDKIMNRFRSYFGGKKGMRKR